MKRSDAFPNRYVSKDDVESPVVWTIANVVLVEMDDDNGGKKKPPVMHFSDPDSKPLIMNNSNWMTLEDLYGDESDNWTGKKIELYKDPNVMFGGKRVGGVRVRKPASSGNGSGHAQHFTIENLKAIREQLRGLGVTPRTLKDTEIATQAGLDGVYNEHAAILTAKLAETI